MINIKKEILRDLQNMHISTMDVIFNHKYASHLILF